MPDFVGGSELLDRLAAALRDATDARLAVAFWGEGAADALGIHGGNGFRLRIVCNLRSGGTNPGEIRTLRDRGAEVRQLDDLHAKLGVIDDLSFLGSSNMSTNGLGAEGREARWREANVLYDNARPEILNMFDHFWQNAREIGEADLQAAAKAWAVRRRGNAVVAASRGDLSLTDILRNAPAQLDALNVRMVVYDTPTNERDLAVLYQADREARERYGEAFSVYRNWNTMREEAETAYLVDYDWPCRGRIARGSLYRRDTGSFPDFEENGETFHVAFEIDDIEGISFGAEDKAAIRSAFHSYVGDGHTGEHRDVRSYNFPISELASYLPPLT